MTQAHAMRPADPARAALDELYAAARVGAGGAGGIAAIERAYQRIAPLVEWGAAAEEAAAAEAAQDVLLDPFGSLVMEEADDASLTEVELPWETLVPPVPPQGEDPLAGDPSAGAIRGMVATIVREANPSPLAVLLFGSRGRGDYRTRSDVDLLVVVPAGTDTRRVAAAIDALLPVTSVEVDILAATPVRLAAARGDCGSVLHWAQEQGVTLYRADVDDRPRGARDGAPEPVDGAETPGARA